MPELILPAVFWESDDDDNPKSAFITVEDGDVIHIVRDDGFAARILVHEFVELARFVAEEVELYDLEQENSNGTADDLQGAFEESELPF